MPKPRKSSFSAPYVAIVDRLIARRRDLGLTQAELAELYGEDQSFISRIERRQRRIDAYELVRLCGTLKIEPAEVLANLPEDA